MSTLNQRLKAMVRVLGEHRCPVDNNPVVQEDIEFLQKWLDEATPVTVAKKILVSGTPPGKFINDAIESLGLKPAPFGGDGFRSAVFSHARVDGTYRIKIWWASDVAYASIETQKKLLSIIKKEFGKRFIEAYTIPGPRGEGRSFCVVLHQTKEQLAHTNKKWQEKNGQVFR